MVQVKEVIVVCDPSFREVFEGFPPPLALVSFCKPCTSLLVINNLFFSDAMGNYQAELKFALPGKERQDSVYNGLQECAVLKILMTGYFQAFSVISLV